METYGARGRSRVGLAVAALVVDPVVLIALFALISPYYSTQLWWFLRSGWALLLPIAIIVVLVAAAFMAESCLFGAAAGVVLVLSVWWWITYSYHQDQVYAASVQVTATPTSEFGVRVPFEVSDAQVSSNLGDTQGDVQPSMYVPEDASFSTLVEQRGWFSGYSTLLRQQISADTGRNSPAKCGFDESRADARIGGWLSGNLGRLINEQRRWVNWDNGDAYGYCAPDGTPIVVVPLMRQVGVFVVTDEAAGVALYNGRTGQLDIRDNAAGIPGPTYPLSLAATQRESTPALGSLTDYFFGRVGWELPDEEDSINSSNISEYVLADPQHRPVYVTPETVRGKATAISAVTVMSGTFTKPGLAPIVVHRLDVPGHPVWLSPTAITQRVRAEFSDVFAVNRNADIFELAPTGPDTWVVTLGSPQNMLYRVTGRGDLTQPTCLFTLSGQQIRCGRVDDVGVATGGGQLSGGAATATPPVQADSDLARLNEQQLVDLNRRVADELARRSTAGGP